MSQSNYITLALFAIIGLVFLVDYLKRKKEKSFDKSAENFVEKKSNSSDGKILTIILCLFIILASLVLSDKYKHTKISTLNSNSPITKNVKKIKLRTQKKIKLRTQVDGESYFNALKVNPIKRIKNDSTFDINENYMGIIQNGQREGEWHDYNSKNYLIIHGFYNNGLMNGDFKHYDEFGILHHRGSYINGSGKQNQRSGIPESGRTGMHYWYYSNGEFQSTINHINGKYDGIYKKYWNNGVVKGTGRYNNGYFIESSEVGWDRNGKLIK